MCRCGRRKEKNENFKISLDFFGKPCIIISALDTGDLCNGSTPDSDSVCGGSNPSSPAIKRVRKRVPREKPDFIGLFCCPKTVFRSVKIVDVKSAFSL